MGIAHTHPHVHAHTRTRARTQPNRDGILNRIGYFNSSITMPSTSSLDLNINRLTSNHSRLNVDVCVCVCAQVVYDECPCVSLHTRRRVY